MPTVIKRMVASFIAMAVVVSAGLLVARRLGLLIPAWVEWDEGIWVADLDGDGTDEYVSLGDRSCMVRNAQGAILYETDPEWQVSQACVGDVDRDGLPELVMLAWRHGNYGSSRPFWEQEGDSRITEHLNILTMRNGFVQQLWMGHELGAPVQSVASESPGTLLLTTTDGTSARWTWDFFGFTIEEDVAD